MLRAYVRDEKHDLGLATDGDADRIAVIDEQGNYVHITICCCCFTGTCMKSKASAAGWYATWPPPICSIGWRCFWGKMYRDPGRI